MPKLIIYEDINDANTIFETFDLLENRILVGSDIENHLVLRSPHVDPTHASLELRNNHWFLQDLGGPGGTAVNGHLIEGPYMLHQDDIIEIGVIKMRFDNDDPGVTEEYSLAEFAVDETAEFDGFGAEARYVGRIWFAKVASSSVVIIVIIFVLLLAVHFLGLIDISDLFPDWLF